MSLMSQLQEFWNARSRFTKGVFKLAAVLGSAFSIVYNVWMVPQMALFQRAQDNLIITRANIAETIFLCDALEKNPERKDEILKSILKLQDSINKSGEELAVVGSYISRIDLPAARLAHAQIVDFLAWGAQDYYSIVASGQCPTQTRATRGDIFSWQECIITYFPLGPIDIFLFKRRIMGHQREMVGKKSAPPSLNVLALAALNFAISCSK